MSTSVAVLVHPAKSFQDDKINTKLFAFTLFCSLLSVAVLYQLVADFRMRAACYSVYHDKTSNTPCRLSN